MNCYIIDDEQYSIETLTTYIDMTDGIVLAGSSTQPLQGLAEIKRLETIDIVFLDIDMPVLSGIQLANLLPSGISVIFTTAHANYAAEAFDLNASDFLLKPVSLQRFLKAVKRVGEISKRMNKQETVFEDYLFINPGTKGKVIQIKTSTIMYIEGLKNYIIIYTTEGKYVTYLTMQEIQESLSNNQFLRIHKSFCVNKDMIKLIEGNRILLKNDKEIPIGIVFKEALMKLIASRTIKSRRNI